MQTVKDLPFSDRHVTEPAGTNGGNYVSEQPVAYRRIYVWELPVRFFHWANAWCIVFLFCTGYLIGNPQAFFKASEAYQQYWFGWIRFIHFAVAYIVFWVFLFRVYWGFVGNQFARWAHFIPVNREQWHELVETIKLDILHIKEKGAISIGHNYLASLTYIGLFVVFLFQVAGGFALYSSMSEAYLPKLFTWMIPLMGGDANVRKWHHIVSWAFVVFAAIHVYLVFYHDYFEGRGNLSSMLSGWKFGKDAELNR